MKIKLFFYESYINLETRYSKTLNHHWSLFLLIATFPNPKLSLAALHHQFSSSSSSLLSDINKIIERFVLRKCEVPGSISATRLSIECECIQLQMMMDCNNMFKQTSLLIQQYYFQLFIA
ncbi:hypothetical protein QVD17_00016 [Tagetes erecta]|uniref:Uncharacterized protein n=1 Tax=Tagetes erecta TaxID=13708 RepID=A0AAD8P092_TARER|nr:hypothetical protein QVD17_00016 [Tagetes erecta]